MMDKEDQNPDLAIVIRLKELKINTNILYNPLLGKPSKWEIFKLMCLGCWVILKYLWIT